MDLTDDKNRFALGIVGLIVVVSIALAYYGPGPSTGLATAKCSDWDEGYNPVYKGTCTDASGVDHTDACVGPNVVKENYCLNSATCTSQLVNCEFGCSDGACI